MNETIYLTGKIKKEEKTLKDVLDKAKIVHPHPSLGFFHFIYAPLEAANLNKVRLDTKAVEKSLQELRACQCNLEHARLGGCGSIIDAWVTPNDEIEIVVSFFKELYPAEYEEAVELYNTNKLFVSFELRTNKATVEILADGTKKIHEIYWEGVGILLKNNPAYKNARSLEMAMRSIENMLNQDSPELVFANAKEISKYWTKIGEILDKTINEKAIEQKGGNIMDKKSNDALLAAQKQSVINEFGSEATKNWTDEDFLNEEKINALRESLKSTKNQEEEIAEADKDLEVAAKWTVKYINTLPNSSFAVIEPTYLSGKTDNKNARHLPFKDAGGKVNLPHLRDALARANQIKPVTDSISEADLQAKAIAKLNKYRTMLKTAEDQSIKAEELQSKLATEQAEIEKEDATMINEKTTETRVYDVKRDDATGTMEVVETVTTQKEVDGKVVMDEKVVRNTVYASEKVDAMKADYEAKLAEKDTVIASKDAEIKTKSESLIAKDEEIKFVKENAKKITELRAELGEFVKDLSDEDLIKNTDKVEIARLKKASADKDAEIERLKIANPEKTSVTATIKKEVLTAKDTNAVNDDETEDDILEAHLKEKNKKANKK